MESMFQTLMQVPLFHGISYNKLSDIIGTHRFHFAKYTGKERIITAGDNCTHLTTVVSGRVKTTLTSTDERVVVSQILEAPDVIAPGFLFGRTTRHPATVEASGDCGIMRIEKNEYLDILTSDQVFLFNFLNILSLNAQLPTDRLLALTSGDLKKRIAYWIISLTQRNGKGITLECHPGDLHIVFGVSRQTLTSTLSEMKVSGILDFSSSRIEVTDRRLLSELLEP